MKAAQLFPSRIPASLVTHEIEVYRLERMIKPHFHNTVPCVVTQDHDEHCHRLLNANVMTILQLSLALEITE